MHRIDGANPGPGNTFVEGDPQAGTPATQVTEAWHDAVQEELCHVIETAGITLNKPDNTQLRQAIEVLSKPSRMFHQRLINGDFSIWQRGFSFGLTVGQALFTADRWKCSPGTGGSAACTIQKAWQSPAQRDLIGTRYVMTWIQTAAGTNPYLEQKIEDVQTLSGQQAVLSAWIDVAALGSGTSMSIPTDLIQNFGPAGSADVTTAGPTFVVPLAGGVVRVEGVVTIPSVVGKTYNNNTSHHLAVRFKLPSGMTFSVDFFSIQLEAGTVASRQTYRPEQVELDLCYRYFRATYEIDPTNTPVAPGTATDKGSTKTIDSGTDGRGLDRRWNVPMRAAPTITWYSPVTGASGNVRWEGADRAVTGTLDTSLVSPGHPTVAASRAMSALEAHYTADAEI